MGKKCRYFMGIFVMALGLPTVFLGGSLLQIRNHGLSAQTFDIRSRFFSFDFKFPAIRFGLGCIWLYMEICPICCSSRKSFVVREVFWESFLRWLTGRADVETFLLRGV